MVPTYEPDAEFLDESLKSVLQQDTGPEEMQVEVVDDASPNVDVEQLVYRIAGTRVSVFRNPTNLGLAGCWNRCVERARGRWTHILHQDDFVADGFYQKMGGLLDAHPDAGMAFCRNDHVDEHGVVKSIKPLLQSDAGLLHGGVEQLAIRNQLQCPAVIISRDAYRKVGGYAARYSFVLDWEMWLRVASRFPVVYSPETLASFRVRSGSETSRLARTGETVYDAARLIDRFGMYLPEHAVKQAQRHARDWTASLAVDRAGKFLAQGDVALAVTQLRALLETDGRRGNWKRAFKFWISAMVESKSFIPPPLPLRRRSPSKKDDAAGHVQGVL